MAKPPLYRLTYEHGFHPEGITKEQVPEGHGACDAMLMASIIYPPDGSLSVLFIGKDGRPEAAPDHELHDREWFKVFTMLASRLASSKTLGPNQREFAKVVWETFCAGLMAARKG